MLLPLYVHKTSTSPLIPKHQKAIREWTSHLRGMQDRKVRRFHRCSAALPIHYPGSTYNTSWPKPCLLCLCEVQLPACVDHVSVLGIDSCFESAWPSSVYLGVTCVSKLIRVSQRLRKVQLFACMAVDRKAGRLHCLTLSLFFRVMRSSILYTLTSFLVCCKSCGQETVGTPMWRSEKDCLTAVQGEELYLHAL